jgi:hypothetical protein
VLTVYRQRCVARLLSDEAHRCSSDWRIRTYLRLQGWISGSGLRRSQGRIVKPFAKLCLSCKEDWRNDSGLHVAVVVGNINMVPLLVVPRREIDRRKLNAVAKGQLNTSVQDDCKILGIHSGM